MSDVITKLAEAGHLTKERADEIRNTVAEFEKLAREDPEFHAEALEKIGGPFGVKAMDTAKMLGGVALIGGAMNLIGDVYDTAKGAITKSIHYKKMIEANPQFRSADSGTIQRHFSTLHTFNPDYAADPSIAGEYISQRLEREGMDFNQLKNIIDAGKSLQGQRRQSMSEYLTSPSTVAGMVQWEGSPESMKRTQSLEVHQEDMRRRRAQTAAAQQKKRRFEQQYGE